MSIVGARPQFIKAAALSLELRKIHTEILVHTGQHYDANMSAVFFDELAIPKPDYNLGVGSGLHGAQTAAMLMGIEKILARESPALVLVYGDTNSTLAGALAAAQRGVRVAHVEAGLRSFNRAMPEEVNRVIADHLAALLFCPGPAAVKNLANEGITQGVYDVGDVLADVLAVAKTRAREQSRILKDLELTPGRYLLATIHRAENTDDHDRLRHIVEALAKLDETVVFPVHPRTNKALEACGMLPDLNRKTGKNLRMIGPLGYLDMVMLEQSARMILTDAGGVQKEAYWLGVPCITLRSETEWVETVAAGWNVLVGADRVRIMDAVRCFAPPSARPSLYGDGHASARIVDVLKSSPGSGV